MIGAALRMRMRLGTWPKFGRCFWCSDEPQHDFTKTRFEGGPFSGMCFEIDLIPALFASNFIQNVLITSRNSARVRVRFEAQLA